MVSMVSRASKASKARRVRRVRHLIHQMRGRMHDHVPRLVHHRRHIVSYVLLVDTPGRWPAQGRPWRRGGLGAGAALAQGRPWRGLAAALRPP